MKFAAFIALALAAAAVSVRADADVGSTSALLVGSAAAGNGTESDRITAASFPFLIPIGGSKCTRWAGVRCPLAGHGFRSVPRPVRSGIARPSTHQCGAPPTPPTPPPARSYSSAIFTSYRLTFEPSTGCFKFSANAACDPAVGNKCCFANTGKQPQALRRLILETPAGACGARAPTSSGGGGGGDGSDEAPGGRLPLPLQAPILMRAPGPWTPAGSACALQNQGSLGVRYAVNGGRFRKAKVRPTCQGGIRPLAVPDRRATCPRGLHARPGTLSQQQPSPQTRAGVRHRRHP